MGVAAARLETTTLSPSTVPRQNADIPDYPLSDGTAPGASSKITKSAINTGSGTDVRFGDYVLQNVYLRTTHAQRCELIALWEGEDAVSDRTEAKRRSHEAVILVRNGSGELAGLSTVGLVRLKDGRTFYAYRMFLRKRDRVPYLMVAVILATRDFLATFQHPRWQAAGLLHVNENEKLFRPGIRKLFQRHGYSYWGKTPAGEEVWAVEFHPQGHGFARASKWRNALKNIARLCGRRQEPTPTLEFMKAP